MASNLQGTPLSTDHPIAALLQHQQQMDAHMTNLQNAMIQLRQQLGQNLAQLMAAQQMAAQPTLLHSHGNLQSSEGTGINSRHSSLNVKHLWPVEFPTDHTTVTFVLSLLKEATTKCTILFIEGNDLVLDNYQDFMCKLKGHFGDPMSTCKLAILKEYLDVNIKKGFSCPSDSPVLVLTFFVPKKQGEAAATLEGKEGALLCTVHDYKDLNRVTVRDH